MSIEKVQFRIDYHAALTEAACPATPKISRFDLITIVAANVATDLDQLDSALHFDNCCFALGVEGIRNLWQVIEEGRMVFLSFGTMLHTVQDFYAHSNWVELHQDRDPIPVWDLEVASLPPAIVSGTFFDLPRECGPDAPTHEQLNKDSPDSEEGSKVVPSGPNQGKSLFDLAYGAALAASKVQFARLVGVLP